MVEECVDSKYLVEDFRKRILHAFPLEEGKDDVDIQMLEQLYARIKELDEKAINGIWARIIKNAFAPLFCGKFDYVAGNPPWVNWENLPDEYRKRLIPLNQERYRLFLVEGAMAHHGGTKIDIASLMFYSSADNYLRDKGKIGFVITQTLFKSEGAGRGFRRFYIEGQCPLQVNFVDDFVQIKPFEGASNRPSVIIAQKGKSTRYPVPYAFWRKSTKGGRVPEDVLLDEAISLTKRSAWVASPIDCDNLTSPWITGRPRAVNAVKKCIGDSPYSAKPGTCTWASGVYWVSIIATRPDGMVVITNLGERSRPPITSVQAAIEPDLVFPLLRGRDVHQWHAKPSDSIIIAQNPDYPSKGYKESDLKFDLPKTYAFFKEFESLLARRSGYVKYLKPSAQPFYAMYNIGPYTMAPFKVVWREQASFFTCSVIGQEDGKPIIPDHKLLLVPFQNEIEAHYVCASLASSISQYIVKSYIIETQTSTHVLRYVNVPAFNDSNEVHQELAGLSQNAHYATSIGDDAGVRELEQRIDKLVAEVWGLTKDELKEIQESLAELK